ncbi:NAD-dependent epimerase/dehydratase family protein [Alteromonas gilva]|uniref:NAD(P)H-binding protein n=1 Tax=Alteromonas gilva TaxID=2987522 RepID=A0ABT5L5E1_9ALTE|nr:NAD-dependent epimerase/dehydratase family protein [Alteromonas gilva]MDC8832275.1 NAD(P)H-binding protein [Alteromonas gilva]
MAVLKSALILGASGLVGRQLLRELLLDDRYESVTCLVRRPLGQHLYHDPNNKLHPVVVDFDALDDYQGYFGVDHIYCCIGTTLKRAGSLKAFRKVDFEYVHVAAQLARAQRAGGFVWISSAGANAQSGNYYLKVKGELENAIMRMPQLPNAAAVRPGVLIGERPNDRRPREKAAALLLQWLRPLLIGRLKKYRAVHPYQVALEMIRHQEF